MTSPYCAKCIANRLEEHGSFNGTEGLGRTVKRIGGLDLCGDHVVEALKEADIAGTALRAINEVLRELDKLPRDESGYVVVNPETLRSCFEAHLGDALGAAAA